MPCSRRMLKCHRRCLHRAMVREYQDSRDAWEIQRETETGNYPAEMREFQEKNPGPTFKNWLIQRGQRRDAATLT